MNTIHVTEKQFEIVTNILTGNYQVLIFGSRLTGKHSKFSDLDIALNADRKKIALTELINLKHQFQDSDLPFKVDLIDLNNVSESFKQHVIDSSCDINKLRPTTEA